MAMSSDDVFSDAQKRLQALKLDWQRKLGADPDNVSKFADLERIDAHISYYRAIIATWAQARKELSSEVAR